MNENPEGTPNPLNPNPTPDMQPNPMAPMPDPVVAPTPEPMPVATPEPVVPEQVMEEIVAEQVTVEPVMTPTMPVEPVMNAEPVASMETAVVTEPVKPKKKKTGWIIAAIIALLIAAGCAVAAILIFKPFGSGNNAVSTAITKLLKGEVPSNIAASGTFNVVSDDETSDLTAMKVDFNLELATLENAGMVGATVTLAFPNEVEVAFDVEGVIAVDGDLYLKIDGLTESLEGMVAEGTDLGDLEMTLGMIGMVEGDYIRIPGEYLEMDSMVTVDDATQCLIDIAEGIGQNGNSLAELYEQNPFIISSTDNVKIASKGNTIYRLGVDSAKADGFFTALWNADFMAANADCAALFETEGSETELPTIYVELNGNDEFTRFYIDAASADGMSAGTLDLSLSYPATIEASEPTDYVEIETILMQLLSGSMGEYTPGAELDIDFNIGNTYEI